mmetsp:Transcript_93818/g.265017  ORF Transcript_93818/g.265017 Transcript_93818/m.265017 type:complete len:905 (+) Transcript_93818:132-2846(+)
MSRPGLAASGGFHNFIVTEKCDLLAWGGNSCGQIGDGTCEDRRFPVKIRTGGAHVVAAGRFHSLLVTDLGEAWVWGLNEDGLLGTGFVKKQVTPFRIISEGVTALAGGWHHSLALLETGEVLAWGSNKYGQLGDGTTEPRTVPTKVLEDVKAIAAGWYHSVALKTSGDVLVWGFNSGVKTYDAPAVLPREVWIGSPCRSVAAGGFHCLALTDTGEVWTWGGNEQGQLGDGSQQRRTQPMRVVSKVSRISAGDNHSAAVTERFEMLVWGFLLTGPPGSDGEWTILPTPTIIPVHGGMHTVCCGSSHILGFNTGGEVFCSGSNMVGQIGDRTDTDRAFPILVLPAMTVEIITEKERKDAFFKGLAQEVDDSNATLQAAQGRKVQYCTTNPGKLPPCVGENVMKPSAEHEKSWGSAAMAGATFRFIGAQGAAGGGNRHRICGMTNTLTLKDRTWLSRHGMTRSSPDLTKAATVRSGTFQETSLRPPRSAPALTNEAAPYGDYRSRAPPPLALTDLSQATMSMALTLYDGGQTIGEMTALPKQLARATRSATGFRRPEARKMDNAMQSDDGGPQVPELLLTIERGETEFARRRREHLEKQRALRVKQEEEEAMRTQLERIRRAARDNPRVRSIRITPPIRVKNLKPYSAPDDLSLLKSVMNDLMNSNIALGAGESKWITDAAVYNVVVAVWKPIIVVSGMLVAHFPKMKYSPEPHRAVADCPFRVTLLGQDRNTWEAGELEDMRGMSETSHWDPIRGSPEWLIVFFGLKGKRSTFPKAYVAPKEEEEEEISEVEAPKGPGKEPPLLLQQLSVMGLGAAASQEPVLATSTLDSVYEKLRNPLPADRMVALDALMRLAPIGDQRALDAAIDMFDDPDECVSQKASRAAMMLNGMAPPRRAQQHLMLAAGS